MDEDARNIIQKQGRLYTERLLSATMESGFDLKAIPVIMLGGGAAVVKGNVSEQDGLCRAFALIDDRVNAEGFERILGHLVGRCEQGMNRPLFGFRPNLQNERHRRAWEILQAVPDGQKNAFLVQAILESEEKETFETTLRRVLREELQAVPSQPVKQPEEAIPQEMMGFLGSLLGED